MSHTDDNRISRRAFVGASASAFLIVPRHVLGRGYTPPSDKTTVASIGMGRQGMAVTMNILKRDDVQVVAVCDCNKGSKDYAEYSPNALLQSERSLLGPGYEKWGEDMASPGEVRLTHSFSTSLGMGGREPAQRLVEAYYAVPSRAGTYKGCKAYTDFRELLEQKDIDAVYVATPDHWHAPISIAAMRKGKHVLCQKPMTHAVAEARRMADVARETRVATSITVTNASSNYTKLIAGWIAEGAIGGVREVHNWSMRPYWPQGVDRPTEEQPVPAGLDWNMWLGPAPLRPYNRAYLPFSWRGWYDFGCGALGDMGCYSMAGIFNILKLAPPVAVEASSSEVYEETYPKASMVHFYFAARGAMPPVRITWYDGGLKPARPDLLPAGQPLSGRDGEGIIYVGEKGAIVAGFNGDRPRVYPESSNYQVPPAQPRGDSSDPVLDQWFAACKGGPAAIANFEAQSPVTETILLGNIALRTLGEKLLWDSANQKITNVAAANRFVTPQYREGFQV